MKRYILALAIILSAGGAHAAPAVTSASGTFSQNGTIVVQGSGFDSKAIAGPLIFGDFENGVTGNSISASGPQIHQGEFASYSTWDRSGGNAINIDTTTPANNSTKHARVTFASTSVWYSFISFGDDFSATGEKRYISYDYRIGISEGMPRQTKALIWYEAASQDRAYMSTAFDRCEWGGWRMHRTQVNDTGLSTSGPAVNNEWIRLENYFVMAPASSATGRWDGALIRANAIDGHSLTNAVLRTDSHPWVQLAIGGGYYDMCDASDPVNIDVDNIYIDNTPQRIEVGNASTIGFVTNREILLPTAWSPTSITATFRAGKFTSGTAWLYIYDASGTPNNNGYPITLSGVSPTPTPDPTPATTPTPFTGSLTGILK